MARPKKTKADAAMDSIKKRNAAMMGAMAQDSYQNILARLGAEMPNIQEASTYVMTRITRNYNLMNALYRNSWLVRKIIDTIPDDMLKNWIRWDSDLKPDDLKLLDRTIRIIQMKKQIAIGMYWGRLYGGAGGLMMIDGQDDLEEPLDIDSVMPGDFRGLMIVDRWNGCYPDLTLVDDINSPEFGLPSYYNFQIQDNTRESIRVHHSRMIRFTGDYLPNWEQQAEQYWGASKIEAMYEDLKRRDSTAANIAGLIFMANTRILKMSDLGQMLTATDQQAQQMFYSTIQAQNWLMSNFGLQLLSQEDDFQSIQLSNFTGINDVYESFMMDLSGATGIPVTKLFGRSPAGMNATGENDMRNYYDMIEREQEAVLAPILDKIQPVLMKSVFGTLPDIEYAFNPVQTPEQKEIADLVKNKTDAVMAVHDRGIISDRTALLELQTMSDGTDMWTNITDDDIAKADDVPSPEGLNIGGMPEDSENEDYDVDAV